MAQGVGARETYQPFKDFHAAQQLGALGGATAAAVMLRPKVAQVWRFIEGCTIYPCDGPRNLLCPTIRVRVAMSTQLQRFRPVSSQNPHDPALLTQVGMVLGANSQPFLSMECYRKALAFDLTHVDAMVGLGRLLKAYVRVQCA